jgi:hypothetical protein
LRYLFRSFYLVFSPVFFVHGFSGAKLSGMQSVGLLLAACVMLPSLIILHGLGHLLVAKVLRLEANVMSLGLGPKLWRAGF